MGSRYIPLGPFTYTAPGDLGSHRDPMLCNELLLRDKPGQPKSRGFYLPGKGFTFGQPNEKREYTAADALRGWTGCFKVSPIKAKAELGRDFIALNRAAVSAGLASPREYYDYRTIHDIRLKPPPDRLTHTTKFPANMVFGKPPRPSTPIFDLLEHRYQDKWIGQRFHVMKAKREKHAKKKTQMMHYDTRASLLRTYQNPVDPAPLWQLPRFANNAKPHLQTFRTYKDKEGSWENHELDHVCRQGTKGQGVYEPSKN
ncbi:hypothetical protein ACOMHN_004688 [Nucella lapillus]